MSQLCDMLELEMALIRPRSIHHNGWGVECAGTEPVVTSWPLIVFDINGEPMAIVFDLVEGKSPLIIRLDLKRRADTMNTTEPPMNRFKRPGDSAYRALLTYIGDDEQGNSRLTNYGVSAPCRVYIQQRLMCPPFSRAMLIG